MTIKNINNLLLHRMFGMFCKKVRFLLCEMIISDRYTEEYKTGYRDALNTIQYKMNEIYKEVRGNEEV